MAQDLKQTKEEVEARLDQRSDSIASRLEAIESEIPVPSEWLKKVFTKRNLVRVGMGLAAGIVAGMLARRLRRSPSRTFHKEIEHVSASIGREIQKQLERGRDARDAVSKALEKRPPIMNLGRTRGTFSSGLMSQLAHQIAAALGPVIAEKIADRFNQKADEK